MSGGGSAKVHVQNRLYVPDPFVVRETRRSLFKVGKFFFAFEFGWYEVKILDENNLSLIRIPSKKSYFQFFVCPFEGNDITNHWF